MSEKSINLTMWLIMAILLGYFAYFKGWIMGDFKNISPQEAYALFETSSLRFVDVRSKKEFDKDHIRGATHIGLDDLAMAYKLFEKETLLVYSERGERSVKAARILSEQGFKVFNLEGGVVFWIRAGYNIEK
jgi:rhodanese-related sulfurtransferase